MSLNEKRIKPGAAKPITGIKRQPARNQIGKQADQALSTAREPISMPEGGAAAEAKLFEKVTARKEPQRGKVCGKDGSEKRRPKDSGQEKREGGAGKERRVQDRGGNEKSGQNNYPYRQAWTKKVR